MLSKLMSYRDMHVSNRKLQVSSAEVDCQRHLLNPFDEMVAAHLR